MALGSSAPGRPSWESLFSTPQLQPQQIYMLKGPLSNGPFYRCISISGRYQRHLTKFVKSHSQSSISSWYFFQLNVLIMLIMFIIMILVIMRIVLILLIMLACLLWIIRLSLRSSDSAYDYNHLELEYICIPLIIWFDMDGLTDSGDICFVYYKS